MKKLILGIAIGFILFFLFIYNGIGNTLEWLGLKLLNAGSTIKQFEESLTEGGKDKIGDLEDLINGGKK